MKFTYNKEDQKFRDMLYEFCKDHYYCNPDDDGIREKWQPFEDYDDDQIEEFINNDFEALRSFIESDNFVKSFLTLQNKSLT